MLGRSEIGQQLRNQIQANVFDLTAKFIVKHAAAKDQPLAEKRLFDTALISTGVRRGQWTDVQLLNRCWAARSRLLEQEVIQLIELVGESGLAHRIAKVEQHPRSAEDARLRPQSVVS